MNKNLDIINFVVSMIIKAVVIAARFSGRVRKRSLKRLAAMEVDAKDKEILFLRDMVEQLQMQVSILQKRIKKKQKKPVILLLLSGRTMAIQKTLMVLKGVWLAGTPNLSWLAIAPIPVSKL